jgi:chromosomal replication initiator protein
LALPAQSELTHAWREIRSELRRVVGESTYEIWLAPLEAVQRDGQVLVVQAPAETRGWVAERFGRIVEKCAASVLGDSVRVQFAKDPRPATTSSDGHPARAAKALSSRVTPDLEITGAFNPRYSFDQFVIGDGNRLAHAASLAVAELPGQAYNPLFLHAPPGLGKTHLLHAIGNYVLAFGGGATVRYTTVESFTNHFINALGSRSLDRFKHAYRDTDVLLIDDVQFLASKVKTEEEFFHTFNALYETGRQLVLTCDRLPRDLTTVEERLRERFQSGLVADIRPPDYATRLTILRKRAALDRIELADPAVLELVAERVSTNIRALEGALIRVVAHHSLTRRAINVELATRVLDGLCPASVGRGRSIADVQQVVADHFGISVAELTSPSRAARVSWPRQIAMHLARELTRASLPVIGEAFGGRNHATVLHACKRVSDRLTTDPEASTTIDELARSIRGTEGDRHY